MALTVKHMAAIFEFLRKSMIAHRLLAKRFLAGRVYGNGFMVFMVMVINHMDVQRAK